MSKVFSLLLGLSPLKKFKGLSEEMSYRKVIMMVAIMMMVFVLPTASLLAQEEEAPTLDLSGLVETLFSYIQMFIPLAIEVMGLPIAIAISFAIISAVGYMLLKSFQNLRGGV